MTLKELRARMSALSPELEALAKKEARTAEDETRLDAILTEINDLGPRIEREVNIEKAATSTRALIAEPNGASAARQVEHDGAEAREQRDLRSPVQRFIESEGYKRAIASGTNRPITKDEPVNVGSFHRRAAMLNIREGDAPLSPADIRALAYSASASTSMVLPEVIGTIYRARERDLRMRDVLAGGGTTSDAITILQENSFTNAAAEVAEATSVSTGAKPESALDFTEVTFPVRTIAHWIPVTRQLIADISFMQTYIEERLNVGLARREDAQILNGNGTPPNLTGLLATSGIQTLDGTYFTGAPVVNAGQVQSENFNRILRAKTLIRLSSVGGAQATFVVINPSDMEKFLTYGDANRLYFGPGPFTGAGIGQLWGLSVVESENIAAGTSLVGDGLMAAVIDRMDATIYTTDSHSDFFIRNILVILAEERLALPVFRPAAFAKVTLA